MPPQDNTKRKRQEQLKAGKSCDRLWCTKPFARGEMVSIKWWVILTFHQQTHETECWLPGKPAGKDKAGLTWIPTQWWEKGEESLIQGCIKVLSGIREPAALVQVQHLIISSSWSSPEYASLPTKSQTHEISDYGLILLISIKAVNILFFNFSLQMNNSCLYKPNYTSTKALERKG